MKNLDPTDGPLHVVRWLRADGRDVKHRYYRRLHNAQAFADKLRAGGWRVQVYTSRTTWLEVASR